MTRAREHTSKKYHSGLLTLCGPDHGRARGRSSDFVQRSVGQQPWQRCGCLSDRAMLWIVAPAHGAKGTSWLDSFR
jgi:hypothetical protein